MKRILFWVVVISIFSGFKPASAFDFSAHGYYRLRLEVSNNLDLQSSSTLQQGTQGDNNRFGTLFYGQHRFRLEPALKVSDNISFHSQVDFLDNVIFGRNDTRELAVSHPLAGTLTLPGGNGAFGVTGGAAGDVVTGGGGNINLRRLYVDLLTPIGKFRLGRQPSHWGLGIFQNDGNDWDSLFGDTFDRFLYIGKYDLKDGSNLSFATLVDFAFQNTGNPAIDLLESTPNRPIIGASHDTYQFTQAVIYERPHLQIGTYAGFRLRNKTDGRVGSPLNKNGVADSSLGAIDGDTRTYYLDGYLKWTRDPITVQAEYVYIGGKIGTGVCIDAIRTIEGVKNPLENPVCLNGSNDLSVSMGALEVDGKHDNEEWKFISGFAQGDSSPLSSRITQFGFRPDYHVGLMMFQDPLGTSPAIQISGQTVLGNKPITSNFVNNAVYVGATYKHKFDLSDIIPQAQWIKVGGHVVSAWAPSRTLDINFAELSGLSNLPHVYNAGRWYGLETDLIVEAKFFDHVFWNLTGGFLLPGTAYDIKNDDLGNAAPGSAINTILFDAANLAFAVRSTLMFEF